MADIYRQAASILLLKPTDSTKSKYVFLIVHKPRKNDSWQLPQGGKEPGEDVAQTALRELQEEAGVTGAQVLGVSREVYQYNFPAGFRRSRPDHVCGQRIEFVFALAPDPVEVKVDANEINDFRWIELPELSKYISRKEYVSLVERIFAEAMAVLQK